MKELAVKAAVRYFLSGLVRCRIEMPGCIVFCRIRVRIIL